MLKVFISQPMNHVAPADIRATREIAEAAIRNMYPDESEIEIIDTYFPDADKSVKPLWYLGEAIKRLAEADVAYFCRDWGRYRGCRIEYVCATDYGITVIEEE